MAGPLTRQPSRGRFLGVPAWREVAGLDAPEGIPYNLSMTRYPAEAPAPEATLGVVYL